MKFTYPLLAALLLMAGAGCAEKKNSYDAMAEELCRCMLPMADFQQAFVDALENPDTTDDAALQELFAEAEQVDRQTQECFAAIEEKFGDLGKEEEAEKIFAALEKSCPDIMSRLNEGMAPAFAPEDFMEEEEIIHDPHEGDEAH